MIDVNMDLVLDSLRELADETYQTDLWLSTGMPEVSSFTECVTRLFDDSGLAIVLEKSHTVFSEDIDKMFAELSNWLAKMDSSRSPHEIIQDPRMARIRALARELSSRLSEWD